MKKRTVLHIALLLALTSANVFAHGGEDHSTAVSGKPVMDDRPQRLPDGSVFLPKSAQRRLVIRTMLTVEAQHPRTLELNGHVVMNPKAGGKVQARLAGRIEAGPKGLPVIGQQVTKDTVLAYIRPVVGSAERTAQMAQLAELQSAKMLAQKNLARLHELEGSVPQRDIDAAEAEWQSLDRRVGAISAGVDGRDVLLAPATGVIASMSAFAGQIVEAKEVLFEIIDPQHLMIEAQLYDAALLDNLADARLVGSKTPLHYLGGGRAMRDGALPLLFGQDKPEQSLALGQPVRLIASTHKSIQGAALPAAAVVRNQANEWIVWVHAGAERFVPTPVNIFPLDGISVVTTSLGTGARVVTNGATLLNQIR